MKIGFFGTPEIASYCLNELIKDFEIAFVVTGEDKPSGRNLQIKPSPVKQLALENSIPVFQPVKLSDAQFIGQLKQKNADAFAVVAYGKIIPADVFLLPPLKTINLHPSLLPKYRGAAPMQWALINGERETGVTVQMINERMDAGDILLQNKIGIDSDMTFKQLYDAVLPLGAGMLKDALNLLNGGKALPVKQNESEATFCKKITKETAKINWNKPASEIHNLVRGLNPIPCSWTVFKEKNIKIYKTKIFTENIAQELKPGFLHTFSKKLLAGTGNGILEILELQPETKKVMDGVSFLNGHRIAAGDNFK